MRTPHDTWKQILLGGLAAGLLINACEMLVGGATLKAARSDALCHQQLADSLLYKRAYFGPLVSSSQSPRERYGYMAPAVRAAAGQGGSRVDILEIGTWAGASAIAWATALRDLTLGGHIICVDPWTYAHGTDFIFRLFQHNVYSTGFDKVIEPKRGRSDQVLPALPDHSFQLIYIDGSHRFKDVVYDIQQAKRLIRNNGIICGDDLELQMRDLDQAEAARAAEGDGHPDLSTRTHTEYHPGVAAAVGAELGVVSAWQGFWAVKLNDGKPEPVALDFLGSKSKASIPADSAETETPMRPFSLLADLFRFPGFLSGMIVIWLYVTITARQGRPGNSINF